MANGRSFNGYVSARAVDLSVTPIIGVEIVQAASGPGVQTIFGLGSDVNNWYRFVVEDSSTVEPLQPKRAANGGQPRMPNAPQTLSFQTSVNGSRFATSVAFNQPQQRFWRFRYDAPANRVFLETSSDRVVWTIQLSADISRDMTRLIAELSAGSFRPVDAPTTAIFDNYLVSQPTRVQFSAPAFTAREDSGSAAITVTRLGTVESSTTVDFATGAGTATPNADYRDVSGTLRFEAGETVKTFQIPLINDALEEGNETINLALSNLVGGAFGANQTSVLTISDDESSSNPIDDSTFFVRQQYRDFLHREPDASGLAFWVNNIESCGADAQCREAKRVDTSAAFFLSLEFQATGYLAIRFYDASFDRFPVFQSEFLPDSQTLSEGLVFGDPNFEPRLEANKRAFAAAFVNRPAFKAKYDRLDSADYVDTLYANAGVTPSEEERTALIVELLTGRRTRAGVLLRVLDDEDFIRQEFNRAFVLMQYFGYLQRDPDTAGYNFWLNKLNQFNGDFRRAEMVKAFITSGEYRGRFGRP